MTGVYLLKLYKQAIRLLLFEEYVPKPPKLFFKGFVKHSAQRGFWEPLFMNSTPGLKKDCCLFPNCSETHPYSSYESYFPAGDDLQWVS